MKLGIVGTGRAAVLHAEAARLARDVQLVGFATRNPSGVQATRMARNFRCKAMTLAEISQTCDAVIVATPPETQLKIAEQLSSSKLESSNRVRAVLMEPPCATTPENAKLVRKTFQNTSSISALTAVNLLHAPQIQRMLSETEKMNPHHIEFRLTAPYTNREYDVKRFFGGGVTIYPGASFWPVLFRLLGSKPQFVLTEQIKYKAGLDCVVQAVIYGMSGRHIKVSMAWAAGIAQSSIEVADKAHVVRAEIWPSLTLEFDGVPVPSNLRQGSARSSFAYSSARISTQSNIAQANVLVSLGFVSQIEHLAQVSLGKLEPYSSLQTAHLCLATALAITASSKTSSNMRDKKIDLRQFL